MLLIRSYLATYPEFLETLESEYPGMESPINAAGNRFTNSK